MICGVKKRAGVFAFLISSTLLFTNLATAASSFESEPANIESLKQTISNSLVAVTCQVPTIGYSENVVITDDDKNNARNSYIVTSYRSLLPCIQNRNLPVTVTYKGKSYKAEVWSWSANPDDDLASVRTSVIVPPIYDWSDYRPQKNWWLLYVQWGEGALLSNPKVPEPVFSTTRIFAVREQEFTFSVSPGPFKVGLMKYGLFFDAAGKFVGSLRWKWDEDPASVTGFPRICSVAGGSSSDRSLLNCNSTRQQLWANFAPNATPSPTRSPSPTATPSPTVSAVNNSAAGIATYNSALDAYNLFKEARQTCLSAFRGSNVSERKVLSIVSGAKICSSQDSVVEDYYKRLLSIRSAAYSSNVSDGTINQLTLITSEIEKCTEAMDTGTVMGQELSALGDNLISVQSFLTQFKSKDRLITKVQSSLPKNLQNSVMKFETYQDYLDTKDLLWDIELSLEEYLKDLAALKSPADSYFEVIEGINDLAYSLEEIGEVNSIVQAVLDSIPNFYCKKSIVSEFPKSGKCKSGFTKVTIRK
jgi:hypothetical protein